MRRTTTAPALFVLLVSTALGAAAAPPNAPKEVTPPPNAPEAPPDVPAEPDVPPEAPGTPPTTPASPPATPAGEAEPARPAAPAPPPHASAIPSEDETDEDASLPANDTVAGHLVIGANLGAIVPFGSFASDFPQSRLIGPGLWAGGDVLYGISRTVAVGAYGDVGMPSGHDEGSGESFTTIAAGAMVRYHLVQGLRFDPWVSAGLGFRRTHSENESLTGIDWARLQVGGDWYASSQFGFGPLLELSLGTFVDSSNGNLGPKAIDAHFVIGGRIVFDSPGK